MLRNDKNDGKYNVIVFEGKLFISTFYYTYYVEKGQKVDFERVKKIPNH